MKRLLFYLDYICIFNTVCQIIGELSDKLNVRHKPNNKEEIIIKELSIEELETIYDKLFNAYLTAIVTSQYISEDKKDLEKIKKTLNKPNNNN